MDSLKGKVILITGASTGLGAHAARTLAGFQARLVLVARSPDKLQAVQADCQTKCGTDNVKTVTADVGKMEDVSRIVAEAVGAFGRLDVLVNNAAAFVFNDLATATPQGFDVTMAVNVRAPFFLAQAASPHLKQAKGSIINISSVASVRPFVECPAYGISKAALECLTKVLALELAEAGVRVNAIRVGITQTDSAAELRELVDAKDQVSADSWAKVQPLGGSCDMDDVAKVVTFLASDLSAAMTGTCLPVERGFSLTPPTYPPDLAEVMSGFRNAGQVNALSSQDTVKNIKAMVAASQAKQSPST